MAANKARSKISYNIYECLRAIWDHETPNVEVEEIVLNTEITSRDDVEIMIDGLFRDRFFLYRKLSNVLLQRKTASYS